MEPSDENAFNDQIPSTSTEQNKSIYDGFQQEFGLSVADIVRQTVNDYIAENCLPGYVFIEEYQMYYNSTNGYYYDPNVGLFYHSTTRCYYRFDEQTSSYCYHSRYPSNEEWQSSKAKRHALSLIDMSFVNGMSRDEIDIFECVFDLTECICDEIDEHSKASSSSNSSEEEEDDEIKSFIKEERLEYGACIRLIEVSYENRLHIITICGAVIGSSGSSFFVDDLKSSASKVYAHITYNEENRIYSITSLSNVEFRVNSLLIVNGETVLVNHGDQWSFEEHILIPHIHHGSNTCPGCEPGLLITESTRQNSQQYHKYAKEKSRKRILRRLKAEYGLLTTGDTNKKFDVSKRGTRNAGEVKLSKNSNKISTIYEFCSAKPLPEYSKTITQSANSSANTVDSYAENKGMKLLKKMGWESGMGLGRELQGITEPIISEIKTDRRGLGMKSEKAVTKTDRSSDKYEKQRILSITRDRFEKLRNINE